MQFTAIGQWLLDGKSPHTGQPVTMTSRMVYPGDRYMDGKELGEPARVIHNMPCDQIGYNRYIVGRDYAIQLARRQVAVGRTPPLIRIDRLDVRFMTVNLARAHGFINPIHYWHVWCTMHDKTADKLLDFKWFTEATIPHYDDTQAAIELLRPVLVDRPADRYQAWTLVFADPAERDARS